MNNKAKTLSLVTLLVCCTNACNAQTLSKAQKQEAIDSLSKYELSQKVTKSTTPTENSDFEPITLPAKKTVLSKKALSKQEPYVCDLTSHITCEGQKVIYEISNRKYEEPVFFKGQKYVVEVYFIDDFGFPLKYENKDSFENLAASKQESEKTKIYEHFIGQDFSNFEPALINSGYGNVGIELHVDQSNELNRFVSDDRVQGIFHIGNNSEPEPEHR